MLKKFFVRWLSELLHSVSDSILNSEGGAIDLLLKRMRAEVLLVIFKLLLGIVITFVAVFSIYEGTQVLLGALSTMENQTTIELIGFFTIFALSVFLLWRLFHPNMKLQASRPTLNESSSQPNKKEQEVNELQILLIPLIEGIVAGLTKEKSNSASAHQSTQESPSQDPSVEDQTSRVF